LVCLTGLEVDQHHAPAEQQQTPTQIRNLDSSEMAEQTPRDAPLGVLRFPVYSPLLDPPEPFESMLDRYVEL
jgi:hypothetical protein